MSEKFDSSDPFVKNLNKKQRERYNQINTSLTIATVNENFRSSLLDEFGTDSFTELGKAAKWAVKNDVSFSEMIPKYREFLEKRSKK
jgi:hypothetical protein